MAAHFSYMCSGILPSAPGGKSKGGRYALLGIYIDYIYIYIYIYITNCYEFY
jgi:hypothetical protein